MEPKLNLTQLAAGGAVLRLLHEAHDRISNELLAMPALARQAESLGSALAGLLSVLPVGNLDRHSSAESQRIHLECCKERESNEMLANYLVYDEFFGLVRVHDLDPLTLVGQTTRTAARFMEDLPYTLLGRGHYRALLAGLATCYEMLFESSNEPALAAAVSPAEGERSMARWRNGHHLFGVVCYFGRECLARAIDHLDEPLVAAEWVHRAGTHLAASSAAMAYAADVPAPTYTNEIRPAMPESFSGSQNADFNHFKLLKGQLHKELIKRKGPWPEELHTALRRFRALDLLDLDVHVIIASEKIGFAASLKQQAKDGAGVSAIEGLRHMAEARKMDFQGI